MRTLSLLSIATILAAGLLVAQEPLTWTTQQDHQNMKDQLGIKTLRPGPSGNAAPGAPNAANYDPEKANPYPDLPDPLTLKNGRKVTTADAWWKQRRPEIVEDFEREVFGRVPANVPVGEMGAEADDQHAWSAACPSSRSSWPATWTTRRIRPSASTSR